MTQQLRILLIEDDDSFAMPVRRVLRNPGAKHNVHHVTRLSEAIDALSSHEFDIVLTDLTLPDAIRLESLEQVRSASHGLPVIVLTLMDSMSLALEAVQAGAQDFIVKDTITPTLLERAIQNAVERQKMVKRNALLIETLLSQQEQLNKKNARLKQLIETTHRFADNVSHEFRTPLTVIREYAALVREGLLGEVNKQQAEFMDVIVYRVDHLNRMVDDMLDSSKLEAGIMGTHRIPNQPADIIKTSIDSLRLKAQVRGVKLTHEFAPDLPVVFCDPEKAGRVITNLAANAIKFTDDNEGRVHIAVCHLPDQGDVEISVSDNGPGIAPADVQRMFERFQQLGTSTQSSTKGFGLGLNIARELVELNYGANSVASELDHGTIFRFTVPVDDWPEIVKRYCIRQDLTYAVAPVSVLEVRVVGELCKIGIRDTDAFWRFTQRPSDLIRKTGEGVWKLLVACAPDELTTVLDRFQFEHKEISRNRPKPLPELSFTTLGCFMAAEVQDVLAVACDEQLCSV